MNISSTEAKLFTIRCDISQATQLQDVMQIAVVTDTIPVAKRIFDLFHYPYQLHSIIISYDLRKFFNKNFNNSITSWDCLSDDKWLSHLLVDKESEFYKISPILHSKTLWDFSRKEECNSIVKKKQMYFQASDHKGKNFLNLNNDNSYSICPSYSKGGAWLKHFSHSNSLCTYITRLITPIGEYRPRFFP